MNGFYYTVPEAPPGSLLTTVHPPHTPLSTPSLRSAHYLRGRPAATRQELVQRGGWPWPRWWLIDILSFRIAYVGSELCTALSGSGAYSREAAVAARTVLRLVLDVTVPPYCIRGLDFYCCGTKYASSDGLMASSTAETSACIHLF